MLLCAVVGGWGPWGVCMLRGTLMFQWPTAPGAQFLLLVVVLVGNHLVGRCWPGARLSRAELTLVAVMMIVAAALPTTGLMSYLFNSMAGAYYYATPENPWAERVLPHMNTALVPGYATLIHQGTGALIVFVAASLWAARGHLRDVARKALLGAADVDDSDEIISYRTAVVRLAVGLAVMMAWLVWAGLAVFWAAMFLLAALVAHPTGPNWTGWLWTGVGGAVTAALVVANRLIVNFPLHPVGFILSHVWYASVMWFSLFVAWACKVLVVRWGVPRGYVRVRPLFIGMILGEFTAGGFWFLVDLLTGVGRNRLF